MKYSAHSLDIPQEITFLKMVKNGRMGTETLRVDKNTCLIDGFIARKNSVISKIKTTENQWKKINQIISEINLDSLETFEASTHRFTFDGAKATYIQIDIGEKTYTSQTFDEGNPPKELVKLYSFLEDNFRK